MRARLRAEEALRKSKKKRETLIARRQEEILNAALHVAHRTSYITMTGAQVAKRAGISPGLINYYYTSMDHLRKSVMHRAVKNGEPVIVAQGLVAKDSIALDAPRAVKFDAIHYLQA